MTPAIDFEGSRRNTILRNLLSRLREKELARIQKLRKDQAGDVLSDPRDTLEDARASEELEVHVDLLARAEDRLAEIHAALERLGANTYGICTKCKREIDLARIRAVPFTEFCADCERQHFARRAGRAGDIGGTTGDEFMSRWRVPEGMVERVGQSEPLELPEPNPSQIAGATLVSAPPATSKRTKQPRAPRPNPPQKRHKR